MQNQVTDKVMMVRPASFQFNSETAVSNAFQKKIDHLSSESILEKAKEEFDAFVNKLRLHKYRNRWKGIFISHVYTQ